MMFPHESSIMNCCWQRRWLWDPSAGEPRLVMSPVRHLRPIRISNYIKHYYRWPWSIGDEDDRDFLNQPTTTYAHATNNTTTEGVDEDGEEDDDEEDEGEDDEDEDDEGEDDEGEEEEESSSEED